MKKKEEIARDAGVTSEGNRAIVKFRVSDFVMILVISLLSLSCILPFIQKPERVIEVHSQRTEIPEKTVRGFGSHLCTET